ncbi:MAG: nuclear transport factor 2 family protein [Cyanobacteria bacterium P01_H01_bin.21]
MIAAQYQVGKACENVAKRYFAAFNAHAFDAAAALFATEGALHPPFEAAIVGQAAIARYLGQEAGQMQVYPDEPYRYDGESSQLHAIGYVDATAFKVGVEWTFVFTNAIEIQSLSIRLRASMKELLAIRSA